MEKSNESLIQLKNQCIQVPNEELMDLILERNTPRMWLNIPKLYREQIIDKVWCRSCQQIGRMQKYTCHKFEEGLLLKGTCGICGGAVERII